MIRPAENCEEFMELLNDWQQIQDRTIVSVEKMSNSSGNPFIKTTMQLIKHDAEKHKIVLQLIRDGITSKATALHPEELASLSDMLNDQLQAEARALELADRAFGNSELFITRYLLSYLTADEEKHHAMIMKLNEFKRTSRLTFSKMTVFGTGGDRYAVPA